MFSNLSRTNECHSCHHSADAIKPGCLSCSNPDPHLKMHPYGIQAGSASYPESFDPQWKLVKCANFAEKTRIAGSRPPASCSLVPSGLPFRNATSWRALGFKVFFRFGNVYVFHPLHGSVHRTSVNAGKWMQHTNLQSSPWIDVTSEVRGTSLEAEFHLTAQCCYCQSLGGATCDFCAGRRQVVDPLPMPLRHAAAV